MMPHLFRKSILAAAEREEIERLVRDSRLTRPLVRRFVAGDTLTDAIAAATALQAKGLTTTLDRLGENVLSRLKI